MYLEYFGLEEMPFSIAPNPRYLYFTHQHQEALAHLVYGLNSDGGIILLTGEVGTGKTTISRKLLEEIPENIDTAWIVNPRLSVEELLAAICDELGIHYPDGNSSIKIFTDLINNYLIDAHGQGRNVVVMIDEAQNLSPQVLEQLRLLTNLETSERKLLQIVLLGQPELKTMLERIDLRQLAQRITARYHLHALDKKETGEYIRHRLAVGGCDRSVFSKRAITLIYQLSHGIPRLINLLCDRSMLGVYSSGKGTMVYPKHVRQAGREVLSEAKVSGRRFLVPAAAAILLFAGIIFLGDSWPEYFGVVKSPMISQQRETLFPTSAGAKNDTTDAGVNVQAGSVSIPKHGQARILTKPEYPDGSEKSSEKKSRIQPAAVADKKTNRQQEPSDIPAIEENEVWNIIEASGTRMLAFQTLSGLWHTGLASTEGDPCDQLLDKKIACLSQHTNMWLLRKFNRPAIFRIMGYDGGFHYAVIRSVSNDHVVVRLGGQQWRIGLTALQERWQDKVTLFWVKPPGYQRPLRKGDSGKLVEWLTAQLDHIQGTMIPAGQTYRMDTVLEERLKSFQKSEDIPVDGVAGELTLMHIHDRIGLDVPRLQSQAEN